MKKGILGKSVLFIPACMHDSLVFCHSKPKQKKGKHLKVFSPLVLSLMLSFRTPDPVIQIGKLYINSSPSLYKPAFH